jgi:hypothetical protein
VGLIITPINFENAQFERRPHGAILMDGQEVAHTLQCVHCGNHFISMKGSGKIRGWCRRCNGPICGPKCHVCVPFEKQLEAMEQNG